MNMNINIFQWSVYVSQTVLFKTLLHGNSSYLCSTRAPFKTSTNIYFLFFLFSFYTCSLPPPPQWSRKSNRFSQRRAKRTNCLGVDSWNCTTFAIRNGRPKTNSLSTKAWPHYMVYFGEYLRELWLLAELWFLWESFRERSETGRVSTIGRNKETEPTNYSIAPKHQGRARSAEAGYLRRYRSLAEHIAKSQRLATAVPIDAQPFNRREYGSADVRQAQGAGPFNLREKQADKEIREGVGKTMQQLTNWIANITHKIPEFMLRIQMEFSRLQDRMKYSDVLQHKDHHLAAKIRLDLKNSETRMKAIKLINKAYKKIITTMTQVKY